MLTYYFRIIAEKKTLSLLLCLFFSSVLLSQYCSPTYSGACANDNITSVELTNISNSSSTCNANYSDYTSSLIEVKRNCDYPFNLNTGTNPQHLAIWVDLNGNGLFSDAGELVFASSFLATNHSGNISIPSSSILGQTRIRFQSSSSNNFGTDGCGNLAAGETEDYTLAISAAFKANAGPDKQVCGTSATFSATPTNTISPAAVGTWSVFAGSGTFGNSNSATSTVSALANGKNIFVWTVDYYGCSKNDTVIINSGIGNTSWTGAANNRVWADAQNWSKGIPVICTQIYIPLASNYPEISSNVNAFEIHITDSAAMLDIKAGGTLNIGSLMNINGYLNNTGTISLSPNVNFTLGEYGTYRHAPEFPTLASSANIFTNSIEAFNATSTLIIEAWHDTEAPLFGQITGNIGHLNINPTYNSPIFNGSAQRWFQYNTWGSRIKGNLTLQNVKITLADNPSVTTGGISGNINLIVGGNIILTGPDAELIGLQHIIDFPLAGSSANVTFEAQSMTINAGRLYLARNNHAIKGMTGNMVLRAFIGMTITDGFINACSSNSGSKAGTSLLVEGDVTVNSIGQFVGVSNSNVNYTHNADTITLSNSAFYYGNRSTTHPSSGNVTMNNMDVVINGGTFHGAIGALGDVTMNLNKVELPQAGTVSKFFGLSGTSGIQTNGSFNLTANSISSSDVNSAIEMMGEKAYGVGNITINGDLNMSAGLLNIKRESGPVNLNITGNLHMNHAELNFYNKFDFTSTNTDLINVQLNGNFTQSGGTFNFDKTTNTTRNSRVFNIRGNFTKTGGTFRTFADQGSVVQFAGLNQQSIKSNDTLRFWRIELNNTNGIKFDSSKFKVNNRLTLIDGQVLLTNSSLRLAPAALTSSGSYGTNHMFITEGSSFIEQEIIADGTLTFPLGENTTSTEYTPINFTFTTGTYNSESAVRVALKNEKHPFNGSNTNYLNRYWTSEALNLSTFGCDISATFIASDTIGLGSKISQAVLESSLSWTRGSNINTNSLQMDFVGETSLGVYSGISNENPTATIVGNNERCTADLATVLRAVATGDSSYTYLWSPSTGLSSNTVKSPLATPSATTTYTVTVTDANGFSITSNPFELKVNQSPNNPATTTAIDYCKDEPTTQLVANGNFIKWFNTPGSQELAAAPTPNSPTVGLQQYYVNDSLNGCFSALVEVNVTIHDLDDGYFTYSADRFCQGQGMILPDSIKETGGQFISTTGLILNTTTGQIDLGSSTLGTYTLDYSTGGYCTDTKQFEIEISEGADASFTYPAIICEFDGDQTAEVNPKASAGTFTSSTLTILNASNGTFEMSSASVGQHTVYNDLSAQNGCFASRDSFELTITARPTEPTHAGPFNLCINRTASPITAAGNDIQWYTTFTGGAGSSVNPTPNTSSAGTTYYFVTQTVDGCESTRDSVEIIVNNQDDPSFTMSASSYCNTGTDPVPTVLGSQGGTFSSTPGLVIDLQTGKVDVSASTMGNYTITYSTNGPCPQDGFAAIEITAGPSASFTYPVPVCLYGISPTANLNSASLAGSYFSQDLTISNNSNGEINLTGLSSGTYRVYHEVPPANGCNTLRDSFDINISAGPAAPAALNYIEYCLNDQAAPLTANGNNLLWYTQSSSVNGSTSVPVPSTIAAGPTVYYVAEQDNNCPGAKTAIEVKILQNQDANFTYSSSAFCVTSNNQSPTGITTAGGSFFGTNGLVINQITGEINLNASGAGSYSVSYSTSGVCPATKSSNVQIDNLNNGSFFYGGNHCVGSLGANPLPTHTGNGATGFFTSTPIGLIFNNTNTGKIDLQGSLAGTYTISHIVPSNGTCPSNNYTSSFTLRPKTVITLSDYTIDCGESIIINSTVNQNSGQYTWTPNGASTANISVSPTSSTIYRVTYITGNGCIGMDSSIVTVTAPNVEVPNYGQACETWPPFTLSGGSPAGGTYSGVGIQNNIFYPSQANLGSNVITYTYNNNGCTGTDNASIFVDQCLGFEEYSEEKKLTVYPNPNNGSFNVKLSENLSGTIQLIDLNGRIISTQEFNNENEFKISQQNLPSGIYQMSITSSDWFATKRIIVQ
jgi:hypothetical protein